MGPAESRIWVLLPGRLLRRATLWGKTLIKNCQRELPGTLRARPATQSALPQQTTSGSQKDHARCSKNCKSWRVRRARYRIAGGSELLVP